jgi:glycosyltransferase involved in cell wall biosynthesis
MRKKLKVLLIDCNSVLEAEQGKCAALAQYNDLELTVLVPSAYRERSRVQHVEKKFDPKYSIIVGTLWGKVPNRTFFVNRLCRAVSQRPDIIHIMADENFFLTLQTLFLRNRISPRSKFVFHSWQNLRFIDRIYPQRNRLLHLIDASIERYVFRYAECGVARNREAAKVLRERGFAGRIEVIPWGIDISRFEKRSSAGLRERYGLRGFVVGYIGRLVEEKGVLDLIQAMARLSGENTLCLVGNGPLSARILALAKKLGLANTVKLFNEVPYREIPAWFNSLDVFVLPSRTSLKWKEQFGRVLVEAMASELPVIGSNSGAIPEVIGDTGLIFEESNVEHLTQQLDLLRRDVLLREKLGQKARQRVLDHFTWQRFAEKTHDLFHQLAGSFS